MNEYAVVHRNPAVLANRVQWLSRGLVWSGLMAGLWKAGHRRAAGVLAAVAVAPQTHDGWATLTNREVTGWSGASEPSARRAYNALRRAHLLIEVELPRADRMRRRVRLPSFALARNTCETFVFPGCLIASDVWPALSPGEQAVAFALASELRTTRWLDDDFEYRVPADVRGWLTDHDAVTVHTQDGPVAEWDASDDTWSCARTARRTGQVSLERLSSLTGMHVGGVSRCVRGLECFADPPILAVCPDPDPAQPRWYHLPARGWISPEHLLGQSTP